MYVYDRMYIAITHLLSAGTIQLRVWFARLLVFVFVLPRCFGLDVVMLMLLFGWYLCSLGRGKWKTVGSLRRLCALCFRLHLLVLLRLQFLANAVRDDLAPVDLGPGNWQLAAHGLERCVGHRLVIL